MKYIGRKVAIGVSAETTKLVGESPKAWLPHRGLTYFERVEEVRSEAAIDQIAIDEGKEIIEKYGQGELTAELGADSFLPVLRALAGQDPTTTGSNPYTHSFALLNNNEHGTITIVLKTPNDTKMFKGAMMNSLEITQSLTDFLTFTTEFISKFPVATTQTVNPNSETKFTKKDLSIKIASNVAGLAAASPLGQIDGLSLSFQKNANRDSEIGTAEPVDFINAGFQASGELSVKHYEDETFRNLMVNGNYRAMELLWSKNGHSLKFVFPRVDFMWEPDRPLNEMVRQRVPFRINYDLANDTQLISTIQLINAVASV